MIRWTSIKQLDVDITYVMREAADGAGVWLLTGDNATPRRIAKDQNLIIFNDLLKIWRENRIDKVSSVMVW